MQVDGILASKGREVRTIQPDATIGEAIGRLCAERVGALVVSEDGRRIAGIISDRGHHLGHRRTWCWRGEGACAHGDDRARDHLQGQGTRSAGSWRS